MSDIHLTLACEDYDRTRALRDGTVKAEGIDLNYVPLEVEEIFWRMCRFEEFDVAAPDRLPSDDAIRAKIETVIADLDHLRAAPIVDPYSGPAILGDLGDEDVRTASFAELA